MADPGLADENRRGPGVRQRVQVAMPRIDNRVREETTTEYLWIVEDDILPPVDTCQRLLRSFDATTVSVSGVYQSRFHPGYVAWDQDGRIFTERGDGVQVIVGQGFGCVILRKSVLDEHVIHHGGRGDYDPTFYAELRGTRWRAKVDWGCEVGQGGRQRLAKNEAKPGSEQSASPRRQNNRRGSGPTQYRFSNGPTVLRDCAGKSPAGNNRQRLESSGNDASAEVPPERRPRGQVRSRAVA